MHWGLTCFFEDVRDFGKIVEIIPQSLIEYVEIRGERPFFSPADTTTEDLLFINGIIRECHLKVTMHATFYDINLASMNPFLQKANLKCYYEYLNLAETIGAEIMVVHAGLIHKDAAGNKKLMQISRNNLVQNLRNIGDAALQKGIRIGLENSPPNKNVLFIPGWKEQISILKEVDHQAVGAVFDMAHAHLHDLNLAEYYENIKKHLIEIHIHNNNGREDLHLGINKGEIDYDSFFRGHTTDVPVIMEIRNITEALESIEWMKEFEK
jgi:sugar phosphate isomerase/epimerase